MDRHVDVLLILPGILSSHFCAAPTSSPGFPTNYFCSKLSRLQRTTNNDSKIRTNYCADCVHVFHNENKTDDINNQIKYRKKRNGKNIKGLKLIFKSFDKGNEKQKRKIAWVISVRKRGKKY